ncbi:MAG: dihydroorotase [Candidatus Muiribacteriota bacterium]
MDQALILKNALVPFANNLKKKDILCLNGLISDISDNIEKAGAEIINCKEKILIPGVIDSYVNFSDPGYTHREDFSTGSLSAVAGGVTTVIDSSSSNIPIVKNPELFKAKQDIIENKSYCDYAFFGGITADEVEKKQLGDAVLLGEKGVCGLEVSMNTNVSTFRHLDNGHLMDVMKSLSNTGYLLIIKPEDFNICDYNIKIFKLKNKNYPRAWCEAKPAIAEEIALETALKLALETNNRIHISNISLAKSVEIIKNYKKRGVDVTCDTNPYYLEFCQEDVNRLGNLSKVTPPFRSPVDRISLWSSISHGWVDIVTSSHTPFEYSTEKDFDGANIWNIYAGTPETQFLLPYMFSEGYLKNKISLKNLIKVLCENPAVRYGLYPEKGGFKKGAFADFALINPDEKTYVKKENIKSKSNFSIFENKTFNCSVDYTIMRGKVIFDKKNNKIAEKEGRFFYRQYI